MAVKNNDIALVLKGKTTDEQAIVLQGIAYQSNDLRLILRGVVGVEDDLPIVLTGKPYDDLGIVFNSKYGDDLGIILSAIDATDILVRYKFMEDEISGFQLTSGDLTNEVTINYNYDFAAGRFKASVTKHNPLSKLFYGDAKQTLSLKMIQHTRQAEKIADAILMTSSIPQITAAFKHDLRSLFIEVGDIVSVTHPAGLGENGYEDAIGMISEQNLDGIKIDYKMIMKASGNLYASELLTLSQTAEPGAAGLTITYEQGVATITIYADIQGSPPVEGAEVTISGVKKITDNKGQVRFNLLPGTYTAYIQASGYEDAEVVFTV